MREFIVTLTHGGKVTVKADDVLSDTGTKHLRLVVADADGERTVALFDRSRVAMVIAREHLISEEKGEPLDSPHLVDPDSEIPF